MSVQSMVALLGDVSARVRQHLPRAEFSMDISPWVSDQRGWLQPFLSARALNLTFMHTSGGRTSARSERIRESDPTSWREIHTISKLGIIADTGYGVAGDSTGHDDAWDQPTNLDARARDGVIALTQANPSPEWLHSIQTLRSHLAPLPADVAHGPCLYLHRAGGNSQAALHSIASPWSLELAALQARAKEWDNGQWTLAVGGFVAAIALLRWLLFSVYRCCCGQKRSPNIPLAAVPSSKAGHRKAPRNETVQEKLPLHPGGARAGIKASVGIESKRTKDKRRSREQ